MMGDYEADNVAANNLNEQFFTTGQKEGFTLFGGGYLTWMIAGNYTPGPGKYLEIVAGAEMILGGLYFVLSGLRSNAKDLSELIQPTPKFKQPYDNPAHPDHISKPTED